MNPSATTPPAGPEPPLPPPAADRIAGPMLIQGIAMSLNAAGGLLVLFVLGRLLGVERFGEYVALLSAAVVGLTLLEGGWPTRIYRDTAGATSASVGHVLMSGAVRHLLGLSIVLAVGLALLWPDRPEYLAALLCMALVAACNLVSARLRGAGRFAHEAGWQLAGRIASGGLILAGAAWLWASVGHVFVYWAAGLLLVLVIGGRRWLAWPARSGWRTAMALTAPFLVIELLLALLFKGDVAVVGWAGASGDSLSYYAACTRLNEAALLAFAPVANVLLRSLRMRQTDAPAFGRLWKRSVLAAALLGCGAIAGSALLGEALMALLFGDAFAGAGQLLPFTAGMLPFALGNLVLVQAVLARGGERRLLMMVAPVAGAMVLAIWIGWRAAEAPGAAMGLAAAHAVVWGLALGWLQRDERRRAEVALGEN